METETVKAIKSLIKESANRQDGAEAMRFSQAALNLAHALQTYKHAQTIGQ